MLEVSAKVHHVLLDLISPRLCEICDEPLALQDHGLCCRCWQRFADQQRLLDYCRLCGRTAGRFSLVDGRCFQCRNRRPAVGYMVRIGTYQGLFRDLLISFKFHNGHHLDRMFGRMLADVICANRDLHSVDVLVPIPLHWRRRITRSYNQSELLAHAVAGILKNQGLNIPINTNLLRIRNTIPQSLLPVSKRLTNLQNAFFARSEAGFEGMHVCLVDDVTTTGTTLQTAARVIKRAGAARVSAAVLAVAEQQ
ncbi:MAG: ComF family protein [Sedimentisphaerales bacterium]|nr:ComF family protein [Sedimentisphaerales bacterium]